MAIWAELEKQHEFRTDHAKTQKKYSEIYESLKSYFNQEPDEKQQQVKQFLKDLDGKEVPEHIMKTINEELQRFLQMDKNSGEMQVTRTYLEYLTKMPYGVRSVENFDLARAREILDEGHYGMEDVK
jgi:ATP-dependent Lon protease